MIKKILQQKNSTCINQSIQSIYLTSCVQQQKWMSTKQCKAQWRATRKANRSTQLVAQISTKFTQNRDRTKTERRTDRQTCSQQVSNKHQYSMCLLRLSRVWQVIGISCCQERFSRRWTWIHTMAVQSSQTFRQFDWRDALLTCVFSTVAVWRSHIGLMSRPCSLSRSPCLKNSAIMRSVHCW